MIETQNRLLRELELGDDGSGPCVAWIIVASTVEASHCELYLSLYVISTPDRYLCVEESIRKSWKSQA